MNLFWSPPGVLALLTGLLAAAAIEDARRLRISNLTCLAVALLAIVAGVLAGPQFGLWQNLVIFVTLLALGTVAFGSGMLGGGDVKLLAALGLWVDFRGALWLMSAIFLAGGMVAILYVVARSVAGSGERVRDRRIPYGVAIAAGAIFTIWIQPPRAVSPTMPSLEQAARHLPTQF